MEMSRKLLDICIWFWRKIRVRGAGRGAFSCTDGVEDMRWGEGPQEPEQREGSEAGPCGLHVDEKQPAEETEGAQSGRRDTGRGASWQPSEESVSGRRLGQQTL